ncbi:class I SAM-dependent methyltransferase [Congregibacter variabilis]|uniref:Class I SAM-dependent methyltransferase n=1 Tax=Congregibacter variabilis TaxID=3081200 RepID=A0ABZ0I7J3_9GAMM|nr:class I SAM-dependent methyltransferase [Congregibacter sp. IMCC43200]
MLTLFKSINVGLSKRALWRLPEQLTEPLFPIYDQMIWSYSSTLKNGVLLDVGGGFLMPAARSRQYMQSCEVIGFDISAAALRKNHDIDFGICADACKSWPLADESVDIVVSRSLIEHLHDTETFARECYRVLKPGGIAIHVLPGKNSPFSILNRLLPNKVSKHLLNWAFPHRKSELGFPAYYQNCAYPAITQLFERHHFQLEVVRLRYFQSSYFMVFFPVFVLSALYDLLLWRLGIKRLASQFLLVVSKANDECSPQIRNHKAGHAIK